MLRKTEVSRRRGDGRQSAALKELVQTQRRRGWPAELLDPAAIVAEQAQQALGGLDALPSGFGNAAEEEFDPGFPFAMLPHGLQVFVVSLPVLLKEQTEIQQRLAQDSTFAQQEGDQQAAQTAIAVKKRPRRPLPSRNGWMVSNWTCTRAAFTSSGRSGVSV
jgi:hypothetical protein